MLLAIVRMGIGPHALSGSVLLNRPEFGVDILLQGYHRLNIAIELNIDLVPVRFAYVSYQ